VYVQNSSQISDDISVNAGIRADFLSYFSPNFNPRLALIINPTENSALKYLFNVGYRTPSIYELFADDESFKVVNVGLKPERLVSNELLFENRVNSTLIYTLSLFYNLFSQIIELSSVYPENADSLYVYKNIDGYRVYGAEVSLIAKPDDKIYFYTNCTYQKSRDSSGHHMTNSPELMLKAGFSYKLSKSIFFSFEGRYESGRDVSYYLRTEPHFLLDFNVGISPEFSGKGYLSFMNNLFLGLRVKNLLDKSYFMPGPNWVSTQFTEQYGRILSFIIRAKV
jgi:outer membrane receptor protein involved in Fe transport